MKLITFLFALSVLQSGYRAQTVYTQESLTTNDIVALNYALTLEHLESTFYSTFQARFKASDFAAAGYPSSVYPYFNMIAAHEAAHVATLKSVITQLGGSPSAACSYNFSAVDSVITYVQMARVLENTGVMAYDGAIDTITDRSLQAAAASIATVEARHAEYLNGLNNYVPFPANFDNATAPAMIALMIKPLLKSCPNAIQLPSVLNISLSFASLKFPNGTTLNDPSQTVITANDYKTLNYALVLEHLEYSFYKKFQALYTSQEFVAAGYKATDYSYFNLIMDHEQAHVNVLTEAISAAGYTPVPYCTYNFSVVKTVHDYVRLAATFENTGVMAYDGAIDTITNKAFQQLAATIATVEGRQAGYLNVLANISSPFPAAFDTGLTPTQIVAIASAFQTCSFTPSLPLVLNLTSTATNAQQTASVSGCTSTANCPASNQCCNDVSLGDTCYDPINYSCFATGSQFLLCSKSDAACGNVCYDPSAYRCCTNGNTQSLAQDSQSC